MATPSYSSGLTEAASAAGLPASGPCYVCGLAATQPFTRPAPDILGPRRPIAGGPPLPNIGNQINASGVQPFIPWQTPNSPGFMSVLVCPTDYANGTATDLGTRAIFRAACAATSTSLGLT